jgi:peptidoglycan-associated lipoprotein
MRLNKIFSVSLLCVAMIGCASDGGTTDDAAITGKAVTDSQTQAVPESPGVDVVTQEQSQMEVVANPLLDQTIIYFGYDRAELRPEFKDVLNAHAQFLQVNPDANMVLEGHCDERGTVEYNLALGERRADTVKRYLIVQGVNPSQLESVSFGEERPAMLGSTDSAWSKNRRTEIKY